jgi:hypothetical protein
VIHVATHEAAARRAEIKLAWEMALDRLDLDVTMAQRLLGSGQQPAPAPWDTPQIDGPIPARLLPRALDIQRRQALVERAMRDALTSNGKHRAFADRVSAKSVNGLVAPAYVDLHA